MSSPPPTAPQEGGGDRIPWWMPGESTALRIGVFAALCVAALLTLLAASYTIWRWRKWMQRNWRPGRHNSRPPAHKSLDGTSGGTGLRRGSGADGHSTEAVHSANGLQLGAAAVPAPASVASAQSRDETREHVPLIPQRRYDSRTDATQQRPQVQGLQLSERPPGSAGSGTGASSPGPDGGLASDGDRGAPGPYGCLESPPCSAREHDTAHLLGGSRPRQASDGTAEPGGCGEGGDAGDSATGSAEKLCASGHARASAALDSVREVSGLHASADACKGGDSGGDSICRGSTGGVVSGGAAHASTPLGDSCGGGTLPRCVPVPPGAAAAVAPGCGALAERQLLGGPSTAGGVDSSTRAVRALFDSYQHRDVEWRLRQAVFGSLVVPPSALAVPSPGASPRGAAACAPADPTSPHSPNCRRGAGAPYPEHLVLPPVPQQTHAHGFPSPAAAGTGPGPWALPVEAARFVAHEAVSARDLLVGRARPRPRPRLQLQLAPAARPAAVADAANGAGGSAAASPRGAHSGGPLSPAAGAPMFRPGSGGGFAPQAAVRGARAGAGGEGSPCQVHSPQCEQQHQSHAAAELAMGGAESRGGDGPCAKPDVTAGDGGSGGEHRSADGAAAATKTGPRTSGGGDCGDGGPNELREASFAFAPVQPAAPPQSAGTSWSASTSAVPPPSPRAAAAVVESPSPSLELPLMQLQPEGATAAGPSVSTSAGGPADALAAPTPGTHHVSAHGGGSAAASPGRAPLHTGSLHQAPMRPHGGSPLHPGRTIYATGSPGAPPLAVATVLACLRPTGEDAGPLLPELLEPGPPAQQQPHPNPFHQHQWNELGPQSSRPPLAAGAPQAQLPPLSPLLLPLLPPRQAADSSAGTDLLFQLHQQQPQLLLPAPGSQVPPDGHARSPSTPPSPSASDPSGPPPASQLAHLLGPGRMWRPSGHPQHGSPSSPGRSVHPNVWGSGGGSVGGGDTSAISCGGGGERVGGSGGSFAVRWQASYMAAAAAAAAAMVAAEQACSNGGAPSRGLTASPPGTGTDACGRAALGASVTLAELPASMDLGTASSGPKEPTAHLHARSAAAATARAAAPGSPAGEPAVVMGSAPPAGGPGAAGGSLELQVQWQQWLHDPGVREAPGWPVGWQHSADPEQLALLERQLALQLVEEQQQQQMQMQQQQGMQELPHDQQPGQQPLLARHWPASGAAGLTDGPLTKSVVERLMIVNPLFGAAAGGSGGGGSGSVGVTGSGLDGGPDSVPLPAEKL